MKEHVEVTPKAITARKVDDFIKVKRRVKEEEEELSYRCCVLDVPAEDPDTDTVTAAYFA